MATSSRATESSEESILPNSDGCSGATRTPQHRGVQPTSTRNSRQLRDADGERRVTNTVGQRGDEKRASSTSGEFERIVAIHEPRAVDDETMIATMATHFLIPVQLNGCKLDALLDSGASQNHIAAKIVERLGLKTHALKSPYRVSIANGAKLTVSTMVRVRLNFGKFSLRLALRVVEMQPSVILGMPFLQAYEPQINWRTMEMLVRRSGVVFRIHAVPHRSSEWNMRLVQDDEGAVSRTMKLESEEERHEEVTRKQTRESDEGQHDGEVTKPNVERDEPKLLHTTSEAQVPVSTDEN